MICLYVKVFMVIILDINPVLTYSCKAATIKIPSLPALKICNLTFDSTTKVAEYRIVTTNLMESNNEH